VSGRRPALVLASACSVLFVPLLAACADNKPSSEQGGDRRAITVKATDTGCEVSSDTAPSGPLTFSVTNTGTKVNEFYLLASDGQRIIGEVENIAPGLARDLVVTATPGSYFTACKPGMVGEGVRSPFAVTDAREGLTPPEDEQRLAAKAGREYQAYVQDQTRRLVTQTNAFAAAYVAGDDAKARTLYPRARLHWERIEPVAESVEDLDAAIDAREADLEPGQSWKGWHRIEKDLWPARAKGYRALRDADRRTYAADLVKNTASLDTRMRGQTFTPDQIANGARGLLDEVANTKVTGEEEYWSRTDLWDFQGNLDGARVGFEALRPLLQKKEPQLDGQINARFAALQKLLDQHRSGSGFVSYDDLSQSEVRTLSNGVNALAELVSRLTAAVV
jgi:iron uptake system component EfeO